MPKGPEAPTEREREEHEAAGHVVHRNWCHHCVSSRAVDNPHRPATEELENAVPTVMLDYMFMGQTDEGTMPMLAI